VRVRIDQYYISRVEIGTPGHVNLDGQIWDVKVQRSTRSKEQRIRSGRRVRRPGARLAQARPDPDRRAQLRQAGADPRGRQGGYYQQTSGRWVYLVSKDGRSARRTDVRLGRQNPRQVEVLEGLQPGDRIITSSYDAYNGVDELKFDEALKPTPATAGL